MASTGSLSPDSYVNPSLPLFAMLAPVWLQDRLARAGLLHGHAADPLLLARIFSAVAGAAAVLVLGLAAARTHPALGAGPAWLLALFPGFVNLCHFATPEPWLLLGTAATLAVAIAHAEGRAPAALLGLVLGLTASTKYTAAALAVPALAAVWLRAPEPGERPARARMAAVGGLALALGAVLLFDGGAAIAARLRMDDARLLHPESALRFVHRLAVAGAVAGVAALGAAAAPAGTAIARFARPATATVVAAAVLGFLLGSPMVIAEPVRLLSGLAFNDQTRFEYKGLVGQGSSFAAYLGLLADALTVPALLAAAAGLALALMRGRMGDRAAIVVALGAIAPFVLVAASAHRAMRFLAPVLPPAAWLAALGLSALQGRRARAAAAALVAGRAALASLLVVRLFHVDSRAQAARWMERNLPRGAAVDLIANLPGYAPAVPEGRTLRVVPTLSREMAPAERFAEAARRYPAEASPWLVLTASYYERFLDHPDQAPERAAFFRALLDGSAGFEVAARFQQRGWRRPAVEFVDPEIVILRRVSPRSGT
jgi:hypothetical protein